MAIEARLEVVQGEEQGLVVPLAAGTVTLGRAPGNTIVVKDATVSRQHAKLFERDGRHFVADLNSSHGTFVNGARITLQALAAGDEVKLGATTYRYALGPAAPARPAPPSTAPQKPATPAADEGSFELELDVAPAAPAAPKPAAPPPAKPLPPVNTTYRRATTATGEDPFAEDAPAASAASAAPAKPAPAAAEIPQFELRGRTAENFAARGSGGPAAAAPVRGTTHTPPPLRDAGRRRRGPFAFIGDELDQRGPAARAVAMLFALAVAGGLLWVTLRLFDAAPKPKATVDPEVPSGAEPPSLPPRKN